MKTVVGTIVGIFVLSVALVAQSATTSGITGTVKDQTGAVLPGVGIQVTQTTTGLVRSTVTDDRGTFRFRNLPVGRYDLEATLSGFSTYTERGIVLEVNSNPEIPIVLAIGNLAETIEISANSNYIETRNTTVGHVMDHQRVLELPLQGRNIADLVLLSPSAVASGGFNNNRTYPVTAVSVSGGGGAQLSYRLDGADHNNIENNQNLPLPFPDALQEFKLDTGGADARTGRSASGTVNVVTKSGTNDFHGNAFWYVRNAIFNARNPFLAERDDSLKRNQFGGTVGGPLKENKLFWFAGYQFTSERSDPQSREVDLPTPAMRQGDFSYQMSAACQGRDITLKAPFVNNKIDPSRFDAGSKQILSFLPIPTDPCGRYRYGFPDRPDDHMLLTKFDYNKSEGHTMFARYLFSHRVRPIPDIDYRKNGLGATYTGQSNIANSLTLGDTYVVSPNFISMSRFATAVTFNDRLRPNNFVAPVDLGYNLVAHNPGDGEFGVEGGFSWGGSGGGHFNMTTFQFSQDFEWVKGDHEIGFGGTIMRARVNMTNNQFSNGNIQYGSDYTGYGYGDFVLGLPDTIRVARGQQDYERATLFSLYVTDTWKVSPRFTIQTGLRWEPYRPYQHQYGWLSHFERANFDSGKRSQVYVNAPPGMMFPGDAGYPGRGMHEGRPYLLAPRIGLVFDPRGEGREVIRVGYGLFYDYPIGAYNVRVTNASPYGGQLTLDKPPLPDPWVNYPGGNPFPIPVADPNLEFPTSSDYYTQPLTLRNTYVQQWNLSIEKRLGKEWSVTATYLGSKTTNIWADRQANPVLYIPGDCKKGEYGLTRDGPCSSRTGANINARKLLTLQDPVNGPFYNSVIETVQGGDGNFNSAVLSVKKRFSRSYTAQANYTWGHCISDYDASQWLDGQDYINWRDRDADRGNCNQDRRHNLNSSFIVATPGMGEGFVRQLTGGWQVSSIVKVQSGSPLTAWARRDTGLLSSKQYPDRIKDPKLDNGTIAKWFDTSAFVDNSPGTYGNAGRNIMTGPRLWAFDVGVTRRFQVAENQRVEFKWEMFNFLNSFRPDDPGTNELRTNHRNFGQIRVARDPRVMQFALKYYF